MLLRQKASISREILNTTTRPKGDEGAPVLGG